VRVLRLSPPEKLITSRFGNENDNYLMAALKHRNFDALSYLMENVEGFDYSYQNSAG